jgi:ATP-dependent DNA ligase
VHPRPHPNHKNPGKSHPPLCLRDHSKASTGRSRTRNAGRAGTGLPEAELERLWQRHQPLVVDKMPLAEAAATREPVRLAARANPGKAMDPWPIVATDIIPAKLDR